MQLVRHTFIITSLIFQVKLLLSAKCLLFNELSITIFSMFLSVIIPKSFSNCPGSNMGPRRVKSTMHETHYTLLKVHHEKLRTHEQAYHLTLYNNTCRNTSVFSRMPRLAFSSSGHFDARGANPCR